MQPVRHRDGKPRRSHAIVDRDALRAERDGGLTVGEICRQRMLVSKRNAPRLEVLAQAVLARFRGISPSRDLHPGGQVPIRDRYAAQQHMARIAYQRLVQLQRQRMFAAWRRGCRVRS